jgi:hypothetical protein
MCREWMKIREERMGSKIDLKFSWPIEVSKGRKLM